MRPVVLLDVDGVKANFLRCALRVVKEVTGKEFSPEDFPTWDIFDTIGKEHEKACYAEFDKPGFCAGLEPYPGAVEGVRHIMEIADVYAVTSPMYSSPYWMWERTKWLFEHFGLKSKQVIHCSAKHLVRGDIFVDDKPDHVIRWARAHPNGTTLLWDQPYNRSIDEFPTWARVQDWDHVLRIVTDWTSARMERDRLG